MRKPFALRLHGAPAKVVDRMIEAGIAATHHEAVELALLHYGRQSGIVEEKELIQSLRAAAAKGPLPEPALVDGIRRAKGAHVPRR
jgi:hypothetical protein